MGKVNSVKIVRNPFTNVIMNEVYVNGKGIFRRNRIYNVYNSVLDYEQLKETDLVNIDYNKSI